MMVNFQTDFFYEISVNFQLILSSTCGDIVLT